MLDSIRNVISGKKGKEEIDSLVTESIAIRIKKYERAIKEILLIESCVKNNLANEKPENHSFAIMKKEINKDKEYIEKHLKGRSKKVKEKADELFTLMDKYLAKKKELFDILSNKLKSSEVKIGTQKNISNVFEK